MDVLHVRGNRQFIGDAAEPAGAVEGLESATAWREFDHDYTPLLRNVARKAGLTEAEADEVAQET